MSAAGGPAHCLRRRIRFWGKSLKLRGVCAGLRPLRGPMIFQRVCGLSLANMRGRRAAPAPLGQPVQQRLGVVEARGQRLRPKRIARNHLIREPTPGHCAKLRQRSQFRQAVRPGHQLLLQRVGPRDAGDQGLGIGTLQPIEHDVRAPGPWQREFRPRARVILGQPARKAAEMCDDRVRHRIGVMGRATHGQKRRTCAFSPLIRDNLPIWVTTWPRSRPWCPAWRGAGG